MRPTLRSIRFRGGFTLIELLVVIAIIGLISAAALPVILPALNERRVSEAARLVQATLAGTRDAAIRANAPRGIRLLPDPVFSFGANVGGGPLASNRIVAIEPAPDYSEGTVNGYVAPTDKGFAPYKGAPGYSVSGSYTVTTGSGGVVSYLRIQSNEVTSTTTPDPKDPKSTITVPVAQIPTGWQNNIRQGDKIRFNDSGAYYTIAGPIHGRTVLNNPERFICYKPLSGNGGSNESSLSMYGDPASRLNTSLPLEYLDLTNGIDDDFDGWIDESCDGIDNDGDGIVDPGFNGIDDDNQNGIDDPGEFFIFRDSTGKVNATGGDEYEVETFIGIQTSTPPENTDYTITRQPVVSPNAVETTLPAGAVIDLTTWNAAASTPADSPVPFLPERSRLPVNPFSGFVDIMIDQTGRVVPPGAGSGNGTYNANSPLASLPFYHFWVTEREGVVVPLYGPQSSSVGYLIPKPNPNYKATTPQTYLLPMPQGLGTVDSNSQPAVLKGQRRLITLFTKTGQIVSNSIETFSVNDTSAPYYDAQNGTKESL